MEIDSLSKPFLGVRFVLFGFDPINEHQVRSKLVEGGGVDVGRYSQNCTHVIVDKIVYDESVCVAARNDGKTLVTLLWVDHSYDVGMPVDATSIMYKPLKDLNGIPGAKDLVVCLTGYQRQDRDDIMTMVGLMGAQFSKPLVANKVTHLICYKFEGEKYELAKKITKIKLVNHRWLEDCLRDWKLLPEANYDKSGYELEMMEAEAQDSEEETEDVTLKKFGGQGMNKSPHNLKVVMASARESPKPTMEVPKMLLNSTVPAHPSGVNAEDLLSTPIKASGYDQYSSFDNVNASEGHGTGASTDPSLDRKVENALESTPKEAAMPSHSKSKYSIGHLRKDPRKSPPSVPLAKVSVNVSGSPEVNLGGPKVNDALDIVELEEARTATGCVKAPKKGSESCHEAGSSGSLVRKRMTNVSGATSKFRDKSYDATACNRSPSVNYKTQILEPKSSACHPLENNNHVPLCNDGCHTDEAANLNSALQPHDSSLSFNKKSLTSDMPSNLTVASDTGQNKNADVKVPKASFRGLEESISPSKPYIGNQAGEPQNQQHNNKVSSPKDRDSAIEKSHRPVNLDSLQGGNDKLIAMPLRKKMFAKTTLGPRHVANPKGSIYSNKIASLDNTAVCLGGGEGRTRPGKLSGANELETSPPTLSVEPVKELDTETFTGCGDATGNKTEFMDDETEAPNQKDEPEFSKQLNNENSEAFELTHKGDIMMIIEPGARHVTNDSNIEEMAAKEGVNWSLEKTVCDKKFNLDESTPNRKGIKGKINIARKKHPAGRAKSKSVPADMETLESKKDVEGEDTSNENKTMEKSVLHPGSKTSSNVSMFQLESNLEMEKENRPVVEDQTPSLGVEKSLTKSMNTPTKMNKNFEKVNLNASSVREVMNRLTIEPVWFILSGHRLQRKDFQQVIRRLKGRLCRDSHQWSYQATHFIAPDPIRRTEKFFAAAASGRWILRTDYLSACSQAGKFLPEEPYEWHKSGLNEDGAISLEAPRKWRLLRERTGHGAFYGMRIIVYGECIAPPLDTLKRVVKAGDGHILATSPPYTRFLKSGVDFAVVTPGMPRVDLWIQEFLKHEIPCVVADYLVEFVCKPGYSLERHVLYNTHAWAEKSFAKTLSNAEEIVVDLGRTDSCDGKDISCQVCGCTDRGEVMLICGDETGSFGCGVATHIDCCDPPLENVPEDDWFCPKCARSRINPSKKRKKGTSSSKSK